MMLTKEENQQIPVWNARRFCYLSLEDVVPDFRTIRHWKTRQQDGLVDSSESTQQQLILTR